MGDASGVVCRAAHVITVDQSESIIELDIDIFSELQRVTIMNARKRHLVSALTALLAAGCLPEKRIVWSPDGSKAAVMSDDGLRIATPDGALSEPLIPDARRAAWFADGARLLVIRATKCATWSDVEALLPPADRTRIVELAQSLRSQVLALKGPAADFDPVFAMPTTGGDGLAAAIYLRDQAPQGMAEKLGDIWKELQKAEINVYQAVIFTLNGDKAIEGMRVATRLDDMQEPSVSPTQRHIAFISPTPRVNRGDDDKDSVSLVVLGTDGTGTQPITIEHVAFGYGWSNDGRSLALIHTPIASSKSVTVGAVATAEVVSGDGSLVESSNVKVEDRVGLFFNQFGCARYHKDGRVIFSAHPGTLPATDQEMPRTWSLYAWSPGMKAGSTRLLGRGGDSILTDEQAMFEISPDGTRALMNGAKGDTVVADLTTGDVSVWFDTKESGGGVQSRPTWRTNDEVCAVVPMDVTEEKPSQWVVKIIKGEGDAREISTNWPEGGKGWLKAKSEGGSQPAAGN